MRNMTKEQWEQHQENIQVLAGYKFDYVVTLNTRKLMSRSVLEKKVDEFERRLNRQLFGTNWRQTGKRLTWQHNFEFASGNSHSHSLCKLCEGVDGATFKGKIRHIWKKINKGRSKAQLYVDKIGNHQKVAAYVTKDGNTDLAYA